MFHIPFDTRPKILPRTGGSFQPLHSAIRVPRVVTSLSSALDGPFDAKPSVSLGGMLSPPEPSEPAVKSRYRYVPGLTGLVKQVKLLKIPFSRNSDLVCIRAADQNRGSSVFRRRILRPLLDPVSVRGRSDLSACEAIRRQSTGIGGSCSGFLFGRGDRKY